jgi:hypothetical protein
MFGRLQCYYDRHIATFGNIYYISTSVYFCHITTTIYVFHFLMLLCLVDHNVTMFNRLRRLEMFLAF